MDYRGTRHVLGRTPSAYAIWQLDEGGGPVALYPLSEAGWADAWSRFRELEDVEASSPWAGAEAATLRPMLAGEIVGRAFRIWGRNFWTLAGIAAVLLVPVNALLLALNLSTMRTVQRTVQGSRVGVPEVPPWVTAVANLSTSVVTAILTGAVVVAVAWFLLRRRPTIRASYGVALRKGVSLGWVVILEVFAIAAPLVPGIVILFSAGGGAVGLAGLFLVLLGIVLSAFLLIRLLFAPVAVVVEGRRGTRALERSWQLARGFGGRILGVLLLTALVLGGAFLVVFLMLTPILVQGGLTESTLRLFFIASFVLGALVGIVANPLIHVATMLLYLDARVRKEALTLSELERALPERV
ncbi:MAG: hypothetical protein M3135_07570 [Actinomycetota bacterium]|nr:hypothetical protein [Actinomycetota bacterium]